MQFDPGRVLPTDPELAPLDADLHLVLRNVLIYVRDNDAFAPEAAELARMTGLDDAEVLRRLDRLADLGLVRFSGASWYPVGRTLRLPPVGVPAQSVRMAA